MGISIKKDVTFLSSDDLEGREIGTAGEKKAAAYIVDRFESLNLKAAGTDGFYQKFEVTPSMNPHEQDKIGELWNEYLYRDKRSFNEYFSEEFGFTCDEDITYKQLRLLCVMFFHNKNVKGNLWEK